VLHKLGVGLMTMIVKPYNRAQVRMVIAASGKFPELGRAFYEAGPQCGTSGLRHPKCRVLPQIFYDVPRSGGAGCIGNTVKPPGRGTTEKIAAPRGLLRIPNGCVGFA
jgi:hypothetical protein